MFHTRAGNYSYEASNGATMLCATAVDANIDLISTIGVESGNHAPESYPQRLEQPSTSCKLQHTKHYVAF